jgi:hypothetical protein
MESKISNEELCEIYLDVMALKGLADFIYEHGDETVDKDIFRLYAKQLRSVSKKMVKHLN